MVTRRIARAASAVLKSLIIISGVVVISVPQTVMADGGVGSGGSSGGSTSGVYGWTTYTHGWALYSASGSGPTDGFHTGNWSTVKSTCLNADATSVAIYILGTGTAPPGGTASGDFMGYSDVGYSGAWGTSGTNRDNGRATESWSRATAKSHFDDLGDYGVSTAGYTWGDNVGWFCWDFAPPSATITKHAGDDIDLNVGGSGVYQHWVTTSDVLNTGGDDFDWSISGTGTNVSGTNVNYAGSNPRVPIQSYTLVSSARGSYTRTLDVTGYKSYAEENGDGIQVINVRGWTLGASSSVTTGSVGSAVTFTHSFTNNVTNDVATGDGAPTHVAVTGNVYTGGNTYIKNFSQPAGLSRGTSRSDTNNQTFDQRGTYCQYVNVSKSSESATDFNSTQACVVLAGWDVNANSSIDGAPAATPNKKVIYKGQSATFRHRLWTTGDPLHKNVNGDVLIHTGNFTPASVSSNDCALDGTGPNSCWAYRYTSTDLSSTDSDQTATRTYTFSNAGTYCEYLRYSPSADNDAAVSSGTESCVYVIDPIPTATDGVEYEKNATGVNPPIVFTVSTAGYCPPAGSGTIAVTLRWTLNLTPIATGDVPGNWGNGNCSALTASVSNLNATQVTQLNNSDPGTKYTYTTEVVGYGLPDSGSVTVLEVPFTRFYGNDIYATNGDIRFNDSSNNDATYEDKGAVVQYAGLSFGNVYIDTSAFRLLAAPAYTQPPSSLDAPGSVISSPVLGAIDSNSVYDEVVADLPECSTTGFAEAATLPNENGCWTINDDAQLGIPRIGALDGFGGPNPSTYNHRVTLINQDATKPLMIVGNIENRTLDYTDVANTGVLLIVSAGDIYIDNDVERIDAILVTAKNIYTCGWTSSKTTYGVYTNDEIDNNCRKSLTINGAISANEIKFQRAVGTRNLSLGYDLDLASRNAKCLPWAGVQNCTSRGYATDGTTNIQINNSGGAAEIVNFPAYLYYASPYLEDNSDSGAENDALFQVPPRL